MGETRNYLPVKLIAAITIADEGIWPEVKQQLEESWTPIDSSLDWFDFVFTTYYKDEMGPVLKKGFLSFTKLIPADQLPGIKIYSNSLEADYSVNGNRRINIDPGYVCTPKMVLATTKDFSHRLYLSDGIFGDLHLSYRNGQFRPQPWTYPDYQQPEVLRYFEKVRDNYMIQVGEEMSNY